MNANAQENQPTPDVASVRTYVLTFLALVVLTILTVDLSRGMDLGQFSLAAGMAVATAKSLLVLLIFMHVWHESKLIILVLVASAFFIALFWGMTVLDTRTRGINDPVETEGYYRQANDLPTIMDIKANSAGTTFESDSQKSDDKASDSAKSANAKGDTDAKADDDAQENAKAGDSDDADNGDNADAKAAADGNDDSADSGDAKDGDNADAAEDASDDN